MHKSKSGKSFSVNVRTGAWCCFGGCGKGDMIGFVMTRYHVNFKAAAEYLGAWDGNGSTSRSEIRRQRQARAQEQAEAESQLERRRQDVIDRRTWLHLLERIYKHSNARLSEIRKGAAEQYAGEGETLWGILSDCLPQIRRAAVAYSEAAGVVVAE
jgi:hypothetical protein